MMPIAIPEHLARVRVFISYALPSVTIHLAPCQLLSAWVTCWIAGSGVNYLDSRHARARPQQLLDGQRLGLGGDPGLFRNIGKHLVRMLGQHVATLLGLKVGIARRRLRIEMVQDITDQMECRTALRQPRAHRSSQVVHVEIFDSSTLEDTPQDRP